MEIKPTYVTFEQAKLLKKAEFFDKNIYNEVRLSQPYYYDPKGILRDIDKAFGEKDYDLRDCYNAPEQWQVVEWLRIKHNIWIKVDIAWLNCSNGKWKSWSWSLMNLEKCEPIITTKLITTRTTPQEAYSAAFDYVLKELI